jgi:hypothetical protein
MKDILKFVGDHPILSIIMTSAIVDGVVKIVCLTSGGKVE